MSRLKVKIIGHISVLQEEKNSEFYQNFCNHLNLGGAELEFVVFVYVSVGR